MIKLFSVEGRASAARWLGELLVVVFGVLIALYAQQWASDRQSRQAASDAERRIRAEIFENAFFSAERIALHQCLQQRLEQIVERLNKGGRDWKSFAYDYTDNDLFRVARVYRMPSRDWIDDSYRGALSSGALDSVAPERRAQWSALYRSFANSEEINLQENERSPEIDSLWLDGEVTVNDRRRLLQTVAKLDRDNGLITLIARQSFEQIKELGYRTTGDERREVQNTLTGPEALAGAGRGIAIKRKIYGPCVNANAFKLIDPTLKTD